MTDDPRKTNGHSPVTPSTEQGEWDFYYCRVDDAPASIFLDFGFRKRRLEPTVDTLYFAGLQMLDEGEHGMGGDADARALWAIEDTITEAATSAGFHYVGRVRNHGDWQLTFYGEAGKDDELEAVLIGALDGSDRGYRVGSRPDPKFEYYDTFLFPDAERWQWILNRRVVQALQAEGDDSEIARDVNHWMYFATVEQRAAVAARVEANGFRCEAPVDPKPAGDHPWALRVCRRDPVALSHIHEVVMTLADLAMEHGGEYDGWETSVERG